MKIIPPRPNTAFTKVPNSVLFSNALSYRDKVVWMQLQALCYNREVEFSGLAQVATKLGMPIRNLQRSVQDLVANGMATRNGDTLELEVEREEGEPTAKVQKERRLTRDEKLREELKEIWNKHKPKNAPSMQSFTPARLKTLRIYAERFKVDEQVALRKVLDGSNADEFRRDKAWDFNNIFGSGIPTEDKQGKVEKVYKLGCSKKAAAAVFDVDDDQCWIDWYVSKSHQMTKVVRLEMEQDDAWIHQVDNEGDGTIYVYTFEGRLVHWTYKEGQHGVSYLPTAS